MVLLNADLLFYVRIDWTEKTLYADILLSKQYLIQIYMIIHLHISNLYYYNHLTYTAYSHNNFKICYTQYIPRTHLKFILE